MPMRQTDRKKALEAARELLKEWGRRGGTARAKKLPKEPLQEMARHAIRTQWGNRDTGDATQQEGRARELRCADLVPGCHAVLTGPNNAVVARKATRHAQVVHGLDALPSALLERLTAAIQDKGRRKTGRAGSSAAISRRQGLASAEERRAIAKKAAEARWNKKA